MTAREAAKLSGMPYEVVLTALKTGALRGKKIRNRWHVSPKIAYRFGTVNKRRIAKLSREYVNLYWSGCTVASIQSRVKEDFQKEGIVWPVAGFAEQAIYRSLIRKSHSKRRHEGVFHG